MISIINSAMEFATLSHAGQKRKYSENNYIEHPEEVVSILIQNGCTNDAMVSAAWLHDVCEDCGVTLEVIREYFGVEIEEMVAGLTDVSKPEDGNRKVRKSLDRLHTSKQSAEVKTIKLADLISNSRSIFRWAYEENKDAKAFAKLYASEKEALLEVLKEGDSILYAEAERLLNEYREWAANNK